MYKTKSKEILKSFFIENKDKTFTGNDLVSIFSLEMDKSTIYRQLKKFETSKFVRKSFNSFKNVYEYRYLDQEHNHLHLTCNKCGKIVNLECDLLTHIASSHGFNIDNHKSVIYGLCKECE